MDRRALVLGFLAGGAVVTAVALSGYSPWGNARAEPPGSQTPPPLDPAVPDTPGRTINPVGGSPTRGPGREGYASGGFNNRAIALSAPTSSGESVIFYFDTELQRLIVYQYRSGDRGGIRLMAARHMDYDLRLEGYHDLSETSREDLKAAYEKAFRTGAGAGPSQDLPVKKLEVQPPK